MEIDLTDCKYGDVLVQKNGNRLRYLKKRNSIRYPHRAMYIKLYGEEDPRQYKTSIANDGLMRIGCNSDTDIVEIIKK